MPRKKKDKILRAAAETSHTAAERGTDALDKAVDVIADYVDSLTPYVEKAGKKVQPVAKQARKRSAKAAHHAVESIGPRFNDAFEKVSPAVDAAQKRVADDLLPRLSDLLARVGETEPVQVAGKRGAATVAALKGELEAPKKKKRSRWVRRVAVVAAVGGVGFVAWKKFFGVQDSGWEDYQPSQPYQGSTTTTASPTKPADVPANETPAEAVDRVDVTDGDAGRYGPGSHIGETPPEGFAIKGNERSMKYHTPESGGYDRTIAEVWFESEAAAEAAGFTKAQR